MKNLILIIFLATVGYFAFKHFDGKKEITETVTVTRLMTLKEATTKKLRSRKTGKVKTVKVPAVEKEYSEVTSFKYFKGDDEKTKRAKKRLAEREALAIIRANAKIDREKLRNEERKQQSAKARKLEEKKRLEEEANAKLERRKELSQAQKAEVVKLKKSAVKFYSEILPVMKEMATNFGSTDLNLRCYKMQNTLKSAIKKKSFISEENEKKLNKLISDIDTYNNKKRTEAYNRLYRRWNNGHLRYDSYRRQYNRIYGN